MLFHYREIILIIEHYCSNKVAGRPISVYNLNFVDAGRTAVMIFICQVLFLFIVWDEARGWQVKLWYHMRARAWRFKAASVAKKCILNLNYS